MSVPESTIGNIQNEGVDPVMQAAQLALAEILASPSLELLAVIQRQSRSSDTSQLFRVATLAKTLLADRIGGLRRDPGEEVSPTNVERHSFAWEVLRQARIQLRRFKKGAFPARASVEDARHAFAGVLGPPPYDPFLQALLKLLDVGSDAIHLSAYWAFLKTSAPGQTLHAGTESESIKRLLRWILLSQKEQYVEVTPAGQVVVHFPYMASVLLSELRKLAPGAPIESIAVKTQAESVINEWLDYSSLSDLSFTDTEDGQSPTAAVSQEIARAFIKFNDLNKRIIFRARASDASVDQRVAELEALVRQYAAENRALDDAIQALRQGSPAPAENLVHTDPSEQAGSDLRDFLRVVDSKYSLDALHAIQLGDDTPLTLKSFVAHLFYALRKRGLATYPDTATVTVTYEQSGLYECIGFEVLPGQSIVTSVVARGWAVRAQNRLLPVRRATVKTLD